MGYSSDIKVEKMDKKNYSAVRCCCPSLTFIIVLSKATAAVERYRMVHSRLCETSRLWFQNSIPETETLNSENFEIM